MNAGMGSPPGPRETRTCASPCAPASFRRKTASSIRFLRCRSVSYALRSSEEPRADDAPPRQILAIVAKSQPPACTFAAGVHQRDSLARRSISSRRRERRARVDQFLSSSRGRRASPPFSRFSAAQRSSFRLLMTRANTALRDRRRRKRRRRARSSRSTSLCAFWPAGVEHRIDEISTRVGPVLLPQDVSCDLDQERFQVARDSNR